MYPIYTDIDRTKLIADKSRRGTANLFGIIAYTDANPNIKKVLRDADNWDCFNYLSTGWIIYAIRPEYGQHVTFFTDENGNRRERKAFEYNYDFLQDFGIGPDETFPLFIIAALAGNDRIQSIRVPIDDTTVDSASKSIKSIIVTATGTVSRIDTKYRSSTNVLREVAVDLRALEAKTSLKKANRNFIKYFKPILTVATFSSYF